MSHLSVDIRLEVGKLRLDASLVAPSGATTALVGPNGAGKTTVLRAVLGVVTPVRGRISVDDELLFDADERDVPTEKRRIGYVPQDYGLFPHLTVRENVGFGLDARHPEWDAGRRRGRVQDLLERFELGELSARRPGRLSGGERQRVALARALASEPDVLLLDEPLAALDVTARRRVRESLSEHLATLKLPTVLVTHDPADVEALADRVYVVEDGVVFHAHTNPVDRDGHSEFTREFFDMVRPPAGKPDGAAES